MTKRKLAASTAATPPDGGPDFSETALAAAASDQPEALLKPGWDGTRDFTDNSELLAGGGAAGTEGDGLNGEASAATGVDNADAAPAAGSDQIEVGAEELDEDAVREEQALRLAADTLTGDLRDFLLKRLRFEQSKRPWHERNEAEQQDTIHQVDSSCRTMAERAIELIAAHGLRTIAATIDKATVKDAITVTLVMSKSDPQRHALLDSVGAKVRIIVTDPEEFTGEREAVPVTRDQGDLVARAQAMATHSKLDDNHDTTNPLN